MVSPTLLTEVRVGVAHYHNEAFQSDYGKNDSTDIGIPGVNLGPFTSGMVGITINGYSSPLIGYSASLPWDRAEANIDIVNSWTKILRNHQIKWGVDIRRVRDDLLQDQTFSPRGVITFGDQSDREADLHHGAGDRPAVRLHRLVERPGQRHGQLPAGCSQPGGARREYLLPGFAADAGLCLRRGQLAGLAETDASTWECAGNTIRPPTPHFAGGFSNYNPSNNTLELAGIGSNPDEPGPAAAVQVFRPASGRGVPVVGQDRDTQRLWHQLHAVPGQHLDVQLPGEIE